MLFLRPPLPAADPADRVRSLLARPGGGWVPPAPALDEADDVDEPPLDRASRPDLDQEEPPPEVEPVPSWSAATRPAAHRRPSRWVAALPVSVRSGRVVPGRRAAAALVAVAVLAALVAAALVQRGRPEEVAVPAVVDAGRPVPGGTPSAAPASAGSQVVVAVSGQVLRPGLVRLPAGSRVADAVDAAGGPAPGASTGLLNLARKLVDGEQVLVGVELPAGAAGPPAAGATTGGRSTSAGGGLLDLNTASASDLDALPGIGPVLAQRIVDWRTENDRFGSVEQLREVTGIGEAKFEDLRSKVTV